MSYPKALAAIGAGVLVTLSLAPFHFLPAALLAPALLFWLLRSADCKHAALIGWCFGAGLFGSGASWVYVSIHVFGHTSVPLATLLTALFCGGLAICSAITWALYACLNRSPSHAVLLFAAMWLLGEWLRSWLLTGFPWVFLGYSQTESLLGAYAPLFGVYGIGFLLSASGAWLANALAAYRAGNQALQPLLGGVLLLAWLAALPLQQVEWTQPDAEPKQVALVQANISQHQKWSPDFLRPTLALYEDLSEPYWPSHDLIIWPEAALPLPLTSAGPFLSRIAQNASQTGGALVTGIPSTDANTGRAFNSAVAVGNASGLYNKQRLVPFGEYVPFGSVLGDLMKVFALPLPDMAAGSKQQEPLAIDNWHSQPLICYEIVYPGITARAARDSDVLITLSNDTWFGRSIGPLQHLQMAQMRALETGRYVLRSTGSGVSAIIAPDGSLIAQSDQFQQQVLTGSFHLTAGETPWMRWGSTGIPTVALVYVIICALLRGRNRRSQQ